MAGTGQIPGNGLNFLFFRRMLSSPSVSVIIPLFNAERFFARAIHSIRNQGIEPLEILVVDDGSTDASLEIARELARDYPPMRVWSQPNRGPSSARNAALRQARGELLFFLDADDEYAPGAWKFLLEQFAVLQKNEGVSTQTPLVIRGKLQHLLFQKDSWQLYGEPCDLTVVNTNLYTRPVFDVVGFFDEDLRSCEDTDWLIRAQDLQIPMPQHEKVTLYYRRHDANLTLDKALAKSNRLLMFKKRLDRQRAKQNGS